MGCNSDRFRHSEALAEMAERRPPADPSSSRSMSAPVSADVVVQRNEDVLAAIER
jgi:hypothetical protein